ncbi:MAG TPA: transcriptional regulator [Ruminococcus sp.]|nr:transcriptional regulator [Ruminococcus sp.]
MKKKNVRKHSKNETAVNVLITIAVGILTLALMLLMIFNAPIVRFTTAEREITQVSIMNYLKNRQPVKYIEGEINQSNSDKVSVEYKENVDKLFDDGLDLHQTIEGQFTILFLGFDSKENGGGYLHDVNYLMQFNLNTASLNILQIPRDTYMPAYSNQISKKFNGIYNGGTRRKSKIQRVVNAVQESFGVPVDAYITTTCDNIVNIVDIVGGIPIDMPYRVIFEADKVIEEGEQVLNGQQSEWLVRFRHGYQGGDIDRVQAQRLFMAAAMKKAISMTDLQILTAVNKVYKEELIASDLSLNDIARIADLASTIEMSKVNVFILPGEYCTVGSQATWSIHKQAALDMLNENFRTQQVPLKMDESTIEEWVPEEYYQDTQYDSNSTNLQDVDENGGNAPNFSSHYEDLLKEIQ